MDNTENNKSLIEQAGADLFNFAIDRADIKTLIAHLHEETECKPATVEYELQILKIISVGWSVSFHLESSPFKDELAEVFWKAIHGFSGNLSETTTLMTGRLGISSSFGASTQAYEEAFERGCNYFTWGP